MKPVVNLSLVGQLMLLLIEEKQKNALLQKQLDNLAYQLNDLKEYVFGQRSENNKNLSKTTEDDSSSNEPDIDNNELEFESVDGYFRKKRKGRKSRVPKNIMRARIEYALSEANRTCGCGCGTVLNKIGEKITEQLCIIPETLFIREHVRFKYAGCPNESCVIIATMLPQPIKKGLPSPEIIAHIASNKFEDHLPLYRQEKRFERHGIDLSRQTQCDWLLAGSKVLAPIVDLIQDHVFMTPIINTDDTPIKVQDKGAGKTKTGRLWVYAGSGGDSVPYIFYDYTDSRSHDRLKELFFEYSGYIQADAFPGYDCLFPSNKPDKKTSKKTDSEITKHQHEANESEDPLASEADKLSKSTTCCYLMMLTSPSEDDLKAVEKGESVIYEKSDAGWLIHFRNKKHKRLVKPIKNSKQIDVLTKILSEYDRGQHLTQMSVGDMSNLKRVKEMAKSFGSCPKPTEVGCMMHCRRKFYKIAKQTKNRGSAYDSVQFIKKLYEIERQAKEDKLSYDDRYALRQEKAKPIIEEFYQCLEEKVPHILAKTPLHEAVQYALNHKIALMRYLDDGMLEIDNGYAERLIKPSTIGKKNYLFFGSDAGGEAAAIYYTLIESAKLHGLKSHEYIADLLMRLPAGLYHSLEDLLPHRWKPLKLDTSKPIIVEDLIVAFARGKDVPQGKGQGPPQSTVGSVSKECAPC